MFLFPFLPLLPLASPETLTPPLTRALAPTLALLRKGFWIGKKEQSTKWGGMAMEKTDEWWHTPQQLGKAGWATTSQVSVQTGPGDGLPAGVDAGGTLAYAPHGGASVPPVAQFYSQSVRQL